MMKVVNALGLAIAVLLLLALYIAKTDASDAQERLAELQAELARERGRIGSLTADVAHLESSDHLRGLARAYLGFEPVMPGQAITLAELPRTVPAPASPGVLTAQVRHIEGN